MFYLYIYFFILQKGRFFFKISARAKRYAIDQVVVTRGFYASVSTGGYAAAECGITNCRLSLLLSSRDLFFTVNRGGRPRRSCYISTLVSTTSDSFCTLHTTIPFFFLFSFFFFLFSGILD